MKNLKKIWITPHTDEVFSLTLESSEPGTEYSINVIERQFPKNPTKEHPLRHTVVLGSFGIEDLKLLRNTLDNSISNYGL